MNINAESGNNAQNPNMRYNFIDGEPGSQGMLSSSKGNNNFYTNELRITESELPSHMKMTSINETNIDLSL